MSERMVNFNNSAPELLMRASELLLERGEDYDSKAGERSMGRAVDAFNAITGIGITESEGWLLMECVKNVRQWTSKGYHQDSAEDGIAYSALKAEALAEGK